MKSIISSTSNSSINGDFVLIKVDDSAVFTSISPFPSKDSAPLVSIIKLYAVESATLSAILAVKLFLIVVVIISALGV